MPKSFITIVALFALISLVPASTIYVPDDYSTIQGAIDVAVNGDEIIVRPGIYFENISFDKKTISLKSEQGPDVTVIDGNQAGRVIEIGWTDGNPVLDGFTVTNGYDNQGAGIFCSDSSPTIVNNIINGNTASDYGGGIACKDDSYPTITNNTIIGNTALYNDKGGGGICFVFAEATVRNTILWDNSAPIGKEIYVGISSDVHIDYSDVDGGLSSCYKQPGGSFFWGPGNINVDPLFVDPTNGDYHLQFGSPCIDAGHPNPQYNDPDGTRNDMGALYFSQAGPFPDLNITSMNFDPTSADPNDTISISYTVENIGDTPCGSNFAIGLCLSENSTVDFGDIYLGEDTVPDLNPGDTFTNTISLSVGNNSGNWNLLGYADWTDVVFESDETNNVYAAGRLTINSLWVDATTISRATGGQVTFDLQPGNKYARRQYFLLGSISGTSPGTVLPGGKILPLNRDIFTEYILEYFNYPTFDDFRGWIDCTGQKVATLNVQPDTIPSSWVGAVMFFGFTTESPYDFQSNSVEIEILP